MAQRDAVSLTTVRMRPVDAGEDAAAAADDRDRTGDSRANAGAGADSAGRPLRRV